MARERKAAVLAAGPVEGPWELPKEWQWARLSEACEPSQYGWTTKATSSGHVRFLRTTDISSGRVNWNTVPYCSDVPADLSRYLVKPGDILISRAGSVGKSFLIETPEEAVFASYLIRFRPRSVPKYIHYWLQTAYYWSQIEEQSAGIAVPNVNASKLNLIPVPLPPEDAQRRIVARIDELFTELDDGEAALARARDDLETYRKSLLKAAVTGELTADWRAANPAQETGEQLLQRILADRKARWETEPKNRGRRYKEPVGGVQPGLPDLPEGWAWATLGQLAFISGGLTVDSKRRPTDPVEVPYLRVANVQRGHLDLGVVKTISIDRHRLSDLRLQHGDVLLNEGGDRDKIGRGWVFEGQIDPCVHQNHVFKARPASPAISPHLVSIYLNELGRQFFIDEGKQTTNLASISLSKVSRAPVAVPPTGEAKVILETIQTHTADAEDPLKDISRTSARVRQAILNAAFRGELVQ